MCRREVWAVANAAVASLCVVVLGFIPDDMTVSCERSCGQSSAPPCCKRRSAIETAGMKVVWPLWRWTVAVHRDDRPYPRGSTLRGSTGADWGDLHFGVEPLHCADFEVEVRGGQTSRVFLAPISVSALVRAKAATEFGLMSVVEGNERWAAMAQT